MVNGCVLNGRVLQTPPLHSPTARADVCVCSVLLLGPFLLKNLQGSFVPSLLARGGGRLWKPEVSNSQSPFDLNRSADRLGADCFRPSAWRSLVRRERVTALPAEQELALPPASPAQVEHASIS